MPGKNKCKVLVSGRLPESILESLSAYEVQSNPVDKPMERGEILEAISDKDGLISMITDSIDDELFSRATKLRIVAQFGVGYNNIDVDAATRRGIVVTNTPGVLTDATAELAFTLLLAVSRRVIEGDKMVREGRFTHWAPFLFLGSQVSGKTLGIIGMGRIGKAVARRALGFNMRVIYTSRSRLNPTEEKEHVAEFRSEMKSLLAEADFVTVHVPLAAETRHLIGHHELSLMKKTAFLINTSRGPIIDERALVEALRLGKIAGAGLDVYEDEPRITPELIRLENSVLLPHVGSATLETRTKMAEMAVYNLLAYLRGEKPPNMVNPEIFSK